MARKRASDAPSVPVEQPKEAEIVPDGDFAGMTYDEVLAHLQSGIEEVLGPADIEAVCASLDMVLADVLAVAQETMGPMYAKQAAYNYASTALPYLMLEIEHKPTFRDLKKLKNGTDK